MGNTAVKGYTDVIGKHGLAVYDHTGPASYVVGGETLFATAFGLRSIDFITAMISSDGIYEIVAVSPSGGGGNPTSLRVRWEFATTGSVASVTGTGGTGMTLGTYALTIAAPPAGGVQAVGTLTVLTATTFSTSITTPGRGYLTAPTVSAATGGTPPTLTANLSGEGNEAPAGLNLSGSSIRLMAIGG